MTAEFNLNKLLRDVFDPGPDEVVGVMVDLPHDTIRDKPDWQERRVMAEEWLEGFRTLGNKTLPLIQYPATGAHNADLPENTIDGKPLKETLKTCNIIVAMTEFSATAPLAALAHASDGKLRAASMPGVLRRMEKTALAADYKDVARKVDALSKRLSRAVSASITFSTGQHVEFDLRFRTARKDDGLCRRHGENPIINLPSGEAFIVPYEGERKGDPSRTAGRIPVYDDGETVILEIKSNRIADVQGTGNSAKYLREYFELEPARRNVSELGLGCNELAIVTGNVLEDEKAGLHWAYGRSEHLGGTVGPEAFAKPEYVVHRDIVYARDCPIGIADLFLRYEEGDEELIMKDSDYVIW